jgi:hypothetical protein
MQGISKNGYAAGGKNQYATASQKRLAESLTARSFYFLPCLHNSLSCLRLVYSNYLKCAGPVA